MSVGSDTYNVVSPIGNIIYTCDPEAINQMFRNNSFDKPGNLMSTLTIFGPTMSGTDNQESRLYRKLTTPFFNERTMARVWNNTTSGAESV